MPRFATASDLTPAKRQYAWGVVRANGRYHLPPLVSEAWQPNYAGKHQPWGWMRMSNVIGAYSDQRALQLWQDEMALRGFAERHDLYERLCVMPADASREKWVALAEEARIAAKANAPAARGTARHDMLETWLTQSRAVGTVSMKLQLTEIITAFNDHLLRPVPELTERIIVNEQIQAAGRFDGAVIDLQTGELLIDDLKTKRRQFWTMLEVRAQLAGYTHATAMWCPRTLCYVDPPRFSQDIGIVVHLPVDGDENGKPVVHLLDADLRKGWKTARRAYNVVKDRSEAKSAQGLACKRIPPKLTDVERYALLLAAVETPAEGSKLLAEISAKVGTVPLELQEVAEQSAMRLAGFSHPTQIGATVARVAFLGKP